MEFVSVLTMDGEKNIMSYIKQYRYGKLHEKKEKAA